MGMGPGSKAAQPGPHESAKTVRISAVSRARIREPGSGGWGGWGCYRGSNGIRVLSAWALFSSGGWEGVACQVPLALSQSCLGLDPYLP